MTLFREHRGSLAESMKTMREVTTLEQIAEQFRKEGFGDLVKTLRCDHYCYDDRIKWDTWIIIGNHGPVGFSNGELE